VFCSFPKSLRFIMALVRACVSVATLLGSVDARAFRKSTGQFLDTMTEEELKTSLLEEIENAYGSVSQRGRMATLEASLAPMFKSLPKNEMVSWATQQ